MIEITGYENIGKGKYRTTFDNGTTCVLYRTEAVRYSIMEGAFISEADYEKLITEVVGKRAKKRALHLLEQMDRSERKLREKLTQGGYPDCCVDAAIDYVKSFHYLDDYRFASTYVRYHQDSLSRRQLEQKLMTKGIGRDDINCAIDSEYTADEEKHIAKLLEKKHYDPDNCDEKEFRRIYQFLMYLEDYDGVTIGLCREDFFQVNLPREPLDAWVRFVLTEEGQVWPMGTSAK